MSHSVLPWLKQVAGQPPLILVPGLCLWVVLMHLMDAGLTVAAPQQDNAVDLKREAAFNLVRALEATGARALAMQVMRQHLTI